MRVLACLIVVAALGAGPLPAHAQTCGDADNSGDVSANDALITLVTGVGAGNCPECLCDVDSSGVINASDGLFVLQFGVGQPIVLNCIACPTTTTTMNTTTTTSSTTTTTMLPCMPKSLTGDWNLRVELLEDNCDPLGPVVNVPVELAEDAGGNVTIVSPPLDFNDFMMVRTDCTVSISFNEDEDNGTTFYTGTFDLGPDGDSFAGDLDWEYIEPGFSCDGVERWEGTRQ